MPIPGMIIMSEYDYELPHDRIAEHPVSERDQSKLLLNIRGDLSQVHFYNLPEYLPDGGLMVFNNTRVIRARLVFRKETGARIEIFCLEPVLPLSEISKAFEAHSPVSWKCLIGNAKKWRTGRLKMELGDGMGNLFAERVEDMNGVFLVSFSWDSLQRSFAEVLEATGKIPLPPYIEREDVEEDASRYQTIYATHNGSVAAPTAGLHFTDAVMNAIRKKNIEIENVVLHVGAGTFKPVEHDDIHDHSMHNEQIVISRELIEAILINKGNLTAVGTTSMRSLESLYWYGAMLEQDRNAVFSVEQWIPYGSLPVIDVKKALTNILTRMDELNATVLSGDTSLIIVPGYRFRIADILLTNFHMPKSTLLLLVAAFIGSVWKDAYDYALKNDFRFLSYGDSCLFFRQDQNL